MDFSPMWWPVMFVAGVAAGFVNTVAGGGSFFSYPLLILLGFPAHVANGTIRVTVVLQNLVSVPTYAREGYFLPKDAALASLAAVPAAVLGAFAAARLDPDPFRRVCAVLMIVVLATLFLKPKSWNRKESLAKIRWGRALPLFAAVGFYGGFFQLGAGMPLLAVAVLAGGWDAVSGNSLKVTVILIYTSFALFVLAAHGQVNWAAGALLGAGNMLGAWWGARSAVRRGPGWVRGVLVVMAVLAAARLILNGG